MLRPGRHFGHQVVGHRVCPTVPHVTRHQSPLLECATVQSMQRVGAIDSPAFGGMSFGPGKFDGADPICSLVFESSCEAPKGQGGGSRPCWMPVGDFRPPHY